MPQAAFAREIVPGVHYTSFPKSFGGRKSVKVHVLRVDLNNKRIEVRPGLAKETVGRFETTSRIASNNGAIAGINGGFFDRSYPYLPVGLLVLDGNIIMKSSLNRSAFGICENRDVRFGIPKFVGYVINQSTNEKIQVWGINRPRKDDEVIIYTAEYGWTTGTNNTGVEIIIEDNIVIGISEGNSPIPRNGYVISFHGWTKNYANALPPGAPILADFKLADGWDKFDHVVTGGPRLLDGGNIVLSRSIEKENIGGDLLSRNARTAIGKNDRNELFMVVVEGKKPRRHRRRTGASYLELAQMMKDMGVKDAIGLDGGGSTTMYVNGSVVNNPQDGWQQRVSNAIVVISR